jgi:3-deoxy-D-manno-octulosonic-acid transferase
MSGRQGPVRGVPGLPSRLARFLYICLPLPIYGCLWVAHWLTPSGRSSLAWRLAARLLPPRGKQAIWFHAASVGEVSTIAPVVAEVRKVRPGVPLVVTTMTPGGARRASALLSNVEIALVPFDFLPAMRKFVSALEPACLVIGETEIWPNLVSEAKRQGAYVVMVNGRISSRSHARYRLVKVLIGSVLRDFDLLLMRTDVDAQRILNLGAPAERVEVAGNTKYDILSAPLDDVSKSRVREALGIDRSSKVVTFGSAREGECEIVLGALAAAGVPAAARIVVAPRHMDQVPAIEHLCRMLGLSSATVTDMQPRPAQPAGRPDVIILAAMGHLIEVYGISDIGIVGGTFRPFGGHNPLEPASQGCVTIVGPNIANIRDDMEYLTSRSAALVLLEHQLGQKVMELLLSDRSLEEIGRSAVRAIEANKGIAARCVSSMLKRGLLPRAERDEDR